MTSLEEQRDALERQLAATMQEAMTAEASKEEEKSEHPSALPLQDQVLIKVRQTSD